MDNNIVESQETERKFRLRVVTPLSVAYDKHVEMVITRTSEGDMGIMYNHDKRSALLGDGVLRIFEDVKRDEDLLMVLGGVLAIDNNDVTVLTEIAEHPDKIQELFAELEKERKASEIEDQAAELYTKRMELAIRHALVHMGSSEMPVIINQTENK